MGVSGAGDAPPGVSSFRGSARKDTGGKWGSLGLVTGVLGERGALQGASKIRHSARDSSIGLCFVGHGHGVQGEEGLNSDEFMGRAEDLSPVGIWDWETACENDFWGLFSYFVEKEEFY